MYFTRHPVAHSLVRYITGIRRLHYITMKCPFCAEEIKDDAIFCKHCKSALNKTPAPPLTTGEKIKYHLTKEMTAPVINQPKEGLFLKTLNCGCAAFFILIIIVIYIASIN